MTEVLVVGGGPAGAFTAWSLARLGVDVTVVDRARFPRDKACAEYLSPQASRLLDEMGVLADVEASGAAQLAGMRVRAPSGEIAHGQFGSVRGYRGFRDRGLALRRTVLDAMLLERARSAGATVLEGARVIDVERVGARVAGVRVAAGDGEPERSLGARVVVGADGLRSVVSRRLGLARRARWPRRVALVTHYRGVHGLTDCGEMFLERDGYAGIAPVGGGLANVALVVPAGRAAGIGGDPAGFLERWVLSRPALAPRFEGAERTTPVLASGPFASAATRAWAPGAALVGDAADFFDPFTGEGIFAALRGGELVAPYLYEAVRGRTHRHADHALAAYDRSLRHLFAGKRRVERLVGLAVAVPALGNRTARGLARDRELADLLVGVAGDYVPAAEVLNLSFLARLLFPRRSLGRAAPDVAIVS